MKKKSLGFIARSCACLLPQILSLVAGISLPPTATAAEFGDAAACSALPQASFGDQINGTLEQTTDCFVNPPGRLVDRYRISTQSNAIASLTLGNDVLQGLVGLQIAGDTEETLLGPLIGARGLPTPGTITMEAIIPPGDYLAFATTLNVNAEDPLVGDYTLTLAEHAEPQLGCMPPTFLRVEGPGAQASVSAQDCELPETEGVEASESPRYMDRYQFFLNADEVANLTISTDFDYRLEHWLVSAGSPAVFDGAAEFVPRGQTRTFGIGADYATNHLMVLVAINPGETGNYELFVDDYFDDQYDALSTLYQASNGAGWTDSTGWQGEPGSECTWFGVECDGDVVSGIDLSDNNLSGSIPDALRLLTNLSSLALNDNALSGSIPVRLSHLPLETLLLQNNQLSGSIPRALDELDSLVAADFSNNNLGAVAPGNPAACFNFEALSVGDIFSGSLNDFTDCFVNPPGRLIDRFSLSLGTNTILNLRLDANGFQPLMGISERSDNAEMPIGKPLAASANPGVLAEREVVLPPGDYVLYVASLNVNVANPPVGAYTLTLSESTQAQQDCSLSTYLVPEGPAVSAILASGDCSTTGAEELPVSEVPRLFDWYALSLLPEEVASVSVETDFDYRIEHWRVQNGLNTLQGLGPLVRAGVERNYGFSADGGGTHILKLMAVNPGETGTYTIAASDYFQDQYDALSAFYTAAGGADWTDNSGWLGDPGTECSWFGVLCENGVVREIDLSDNQLAGTLTDDLRLLVDLYSLQLQSNALTGSIPSRLAHLDLQTLNLSDNLFTGTVPAALYRLDSLQMLDTSGNALQEQPITIEFAYEFDGSPAGTAGHFLRGVIEGVLLDDGDTVEVTGLQQAGLAGFEYTISNTIGLRSGRAGVPPVLSLSGDYLDLWVCPAGFTDTEAQDCAFGADGGFLISQNWEPFAGTSVVHAGIAPLGDSFRDSDRPMNANQWAARVRTAQRATLISLFEATDGPNWANVDNWLEESVSECEWYGVSCTDGAVTGIDLSNNQLSGSVPASLYELPALLSLNLSGNTLTGLSLGQPEACTELDVVNVGDVITGSLSHVSDCFVEATGRMVDRVALSLEHNTVLRLGMTTSALQPLVGLVQMGDTPETFLGPLLGARALPFSGTINAEFIVPPGDYIVFASSLNGNGTQPPTGDYTLTISESPAPQIGCFTPAFVFSEGPAALGQVSEGDCVLPEREDVPTSETPRYMDRYALAMDAGERVNIALISSVDYRIEHWVGVGSATPEFVGAAEFVPAGENRVFGIESDVLSTHLFNIIAINPGQSGFYGFAVDDYEEDQYDALLELYESTSGTGWTNSDGWLGEPGSECHWYGIQCADNGVVTAIDLNNNNLAGTLPRALSLLSGLESLVLNDNLLEGTIPVTVAYLENLQRLELQNNLLTGTIPRDITTLDSLGLQDFSGNDLGEVAPGDSAACENFADLIVGADRRGVLTQLTDCFRVEPGRLVDYYQLTLSAPAVLDQELNAGLFLPLTGLWTLTNNPQAPLGALIGVQGGSGTARAQYVLPAGNYVAFAASANTDAENPPTGAYELGMENATEPQDGCGLRTYVVAGSVVNAAVATNDCELPEREGVEGGEIPRYMDEFRLNLLGEDDTLYMVVDTEFDYRLEYWRQAQGPAEMVSVVEHVAAGQSVVYPLTRHDTPLHYINLVAINPGDTGSYTLRFSATEPVTETPETTPDPGTGSGTPTTGTPTTGTPGATINDLEEELNTIEIVEGQEVTEETATRLNNALAGTDTLVEQLGGALPEGSAGLDLALSALSTIDKTLTISSTAKQQGGQVTDAAVVKSLGNVANVLNTMATRSGDISAAQKQSVQTITDSTVTNSAGMIRSGASRQELVNLVAATSAVINAAAGAGAELNSDLAAKTEQLVTKAIKTGISSFAADIDPEDPVQVENLLRNNPEALEFAVSASVAVTSRLQPTTNTINTELSNRGVSAAVSESLGNVLEAVANPDGVRVDGVSATEVLLSALTQFLTGGGSTSGISGGQLLAISSDTVQIEVDPFTGGLIISAPGERYYGAAVNVRVVSSTMPKGISYMRDGRALVVAGGMAIEIAPTPVDLVSFTAAVKAAGYDMRMRKSGGIEISLGNGEFFSGAMAYDNLSGTTGSCEAVQFMEPSGAVNSATYAFEMLCSDGSRQRITPFVHDSRFYDALAAAGSRVSTDRNTGVLQIQGIGRFKPGFFVGAPTAEDQAYLSANATAEGVALQTEDINGDGILDYVFISNVGTQAILGLAQ